MKKFFTYLLAFAAAMTVMTIVSCSKSDEPEEPLPGPTITWASNPDFKPQDITDKMDVKIKVNAPAGIKTFKVAVESNALKDLGITEIDLIEPDENIKPFMGSILGNAGSPKDKTEYSLDFSTIVPLISTLTSEESDHKFTVSIVDKNDQTATRTAVFHRVSMDFTETAVPGVEFDMVYVKGGEFLMGATEDEQTSDPYNDNDFKVHTVTLSSYHIGKFEVTQGLWKAVMGDNPSWFNKSDDYPVEQVSWNDIQEFLTELNKLTGKKYALPTEAQWEYAARGGEKNMGYKYSGSNEIDDVAWHWGNSGSETHPVGELQANELGLHDMSGNVREWCNDWEAPYSHKPQTDPTGPDTGDYRIMRGGSYKSDAEFCYVSYRYADTPDSRNYDNTGFRVVCIP